MAPLPTLPTEILIEVVTWLDPTCDIDRATLCALVRVSHAMWEISAPVLYSTVSLTPEQLVALLDGNTMTVPELRVFNEELDDVRAADSRLRPRARRTFAWIKTLRLRPAPSPPEIYTLWEAAGPRRLWEGAGPNEPLFPAVQTLILDNPPGWEDRLRALNRTIRAEQQRRETEVRKRYLAQRRGATGTDNDDNEDPDLWATHSRRSSVDMDCLDWFDDKEEIFREVDYGFLPGGSGMIFGDVSDACVRGFHGLERLETLPLRSVQNVTVHRQSTEAVLGISFQDGWETHSLLRIFDTGPSAFRLRDLQYRIEGDPLVQDDQGVLRDEPRPGQRLIICLDEHEKYQGDSRSRENILEQGEDIGFLPGPDTFWQLDFDPEPCTVCGKRWEA